MIVINSLTPRFFPVLVPVKYHVISTCNEIKKAFRDLGTLFSGAHVCAKKKSISKKIYICARIAFVCPYVPILINIDSYTILSSCIYLVCSIEKTGSQAGKKRGVRDSAKKTEVLA